MPIVLVGLTIITLFFCLPTLAAGLLETLSGKDINRIDLLKKHSITTGGWIALGASINTDNPNQHNNSPITFNDRSGEVQLNQLDFFIQKAIDVEAKHWHMGARVDVLFGTDSRFTQATGLDNKLISEQDLRFYDLAIPQAYLEVFAPLGNGVTAKIGHFYTLIGQEVVTAPNNFFYSHAYVMQYGEPFTHTGALFTYALSDNLTLNAGAVNGWDNFDQNLANWNFLGGLSWANDDASTSVAWSVISGDVDDVKSDNRSLSSLVISHSFSDKLRYVFQHDIGLQERATALNTQASWYGVNQYLFYDASDTISLGLRGEWFRDNNGVRLTANVPGDYFALTAGFNWQPLACLKFRPEIRYDWADAGQNIYANQTRQQQLSIAMDIVITF